MEEERIKELGIIENYLKNAALRRKINEGALISVDGLLVLNDKEYVVSKSWKYGVNPYVFGLVTLFTNLVGVAVFWIYVKSHTICRNCGKLQSRKDNNCSTCGTALYVKCSE